MASVQDPNTKKQETDVRAQKKRKREEVMKRQELKKKALESEPQPPDLTPEEMKGFEKFLSFRNKWLIWYYNNDRVTLLPFFYCFFRRNLC